MIKKIKYENNDFYFTTFHFFDITINDNTKTVSNLPFYAQRVEKTIHVFLFKSMFLSTLRNSSSSACLSKNRQKEVPS